MSYRRVGYTRPFSESKDEMLFSIEELDDRHMLLLSEKYSAGNRIEKITHRYDQNNRMIETAIYDDADHVLQKDEYQFPTENGMDQIIKTTTYQDGSYDRTIETYQDKNIVRIEKYNDDLIFETETYRYENHQLLEYKKCDSEGTELEKQLYRYVSNKMILEHYSEGVLEGTITRVFDNGKCTEIENSNGKRVHKECYRHDQNNNIVEILFFEDNTPVRKITRDYENNRIVKELDESLFSTPNNLPHYKYYQYDDQNRLASIRENEFFIRYEYL